MMKPTSLSAALLLLVSGSASAAPGLDGKDLRKSYFSSDWAEVKGELPPVAKPIEAEPLPGVVDPGHDPDKPVNDLHNPVAHMFITLKAFEMYSSQYSGSELAQYMGGYTDEKPGSSKHDTVVAGSYEEDKPFANPFNDLMPFNRHFWDYKKGDYAGFPTFDSSVNRSQKYLTGGFGLNGEYDPLWSNNGGKLRGKKGEGVLALYRSGDKGKAFWYLGHIAHLLEDLSVPAHNHLWPHVTEKSDAYESFIKKRHREWVDVPTEPIESFSSLYDVFRKTAEIVHGFDAGSGPGPLGGRNGDEDRGKRRKGYFSEPLLLEEADILIPLVYKRVAALFVFFYTQVDHMGPKAELNSPASSDPARPDQASAAIIELQASASDTQSGVDVNGFRFEYSAWDGKAWGSWRGVSERSTASRTDFTVPSSGLYRLRVTAIDAVGNAGRSAVKYLQIILPEVAAL